MQPHASLAQIFKEGRSVIPWTTAFAQLCNNNYNVCKTILNTQTQKLFLQGPTRCHSWFIKFWGTCRWNYFTQLFISCGVDSSNERGFKGWGPQPDSLYHLVIAFVKTGCSSNCLKYKVTRCLAFRWTEQITADDFALGFGSISVSYCRRGMMHTSPRSACACDHLIAQFADTRGMAHGNNNYDAMFSHSLIRKLAAVHLATANRFTSIPSVLRPL